MSELTIEPGRFVALAYTMLDEHGMVIEDRERPVGFIYGGQDELIGGIDDAILGHSAGDVIEVTVTPEQGFGERDPGLVIIERLEDIPPEFHHVGAEVEMKSETGDSRMFLVTRIADDEVTIDGNHPFAGRTLTVRVRIVEVREPRPDDYVAADEPAETVPPSSRLH